jgi:hypothetical protein
MAQHLAESILTLFMIAGTGFLAQRKNLLGQNGRHVLSNIMLKITFPCLCFHGMTTKVSPEMFGENMAVILMGVLILTLGCISGYIFVIPTKFDGKERKTFVHMMATNNYIFLPLPIVIALMPEQQGTMFLLTLGCALSYWIVGIYPFFHGQGIKNQLKNMFNLPMIALITGLTFSLTGASTIFEKPILRGFLNATNTIGTATVPLGLIFVGAALADIESKVSKRSMLYYSLCRLILFPVIFLPFIMLIVRFGYLSKEAALVPLLISMMPASNTSTMISDRFGGSASLAGSANLYSTPLALLTVPIMFPLLSSLLL